MAYAATAALKKILGGLCLLGSFLASGRAQDAALPGRAIQPTVDATFSWIENISRTSHEPTRKESATYEFGASANAIRQLARDWFLSSGADLHALHVEKYERANHASAMGRVAAQRKFGLGPQAWVLHGSLGGGYKAARLAADRGFDGEAEVRITKRVLPSLRLVARGQWLTHDARSAVFDLNQRIFSLAAEWAVSDRWTFHADVGRQSGNVVANAGPAQWASVLSGERGALIGNYYSSRPWTITHLYGDNWVSYNVEADVDLWSASLAYACTDRTAVTLRRDSAFVVNRVGVTYPSDRWSLALAHRF